MALRPGDVFAGYEILSLVGRGGMGQVYLVQNPHLHRPEALKVISAAVADNSDFHRRFTQEARTAAALNHPAIVTVHHFGVEDGSPWFTMSYLDGATAAESELTRKEILQVTWQLSAALDYAHRRHVIHRDIKPANIVITRDDVDRTIDRAVILDFGIARLVNATTFTVTNAFIGTLAYTAPEIIDGRSASAASDQYSLACTIYELLSGSSPFVDAAPSALMMAHLSRPVPRLGDRDPSLARFDAALGRALAKDPTQRFPDCRSFAVALASAAPPADVHRTAHVAPISHKSVATPSPGPLRAHQPASLQTLPSQTPPQTQAAPSFEAAQRNNSARAATVAASPRSGPPQAPPINTLSPPKRKGINRRLVIIALTCVVAILGSVATYTLFGSTDTLNDVTAVATDGTTICAVNDGSVYCWGANSRGQIGDGTTNDSTSPQRVSKLKGATSLSTGGGTACAVSESSPYCWGRDLTSAGASVESNVLEPKVPYPLNATTAVQTAGGTTCAIDIEQVFCWGATELGESNGISNPEYAGTLNQVSDITVDGETACAINDSDMYCWGNNSFGQIGAAPPTDAPRPQLLDGLPNVSAISTGGGTTCAISNGYPYCWGNNSLGQVGNGTKSNTFVPTRVRALSHASQISTSGGTTCAISDGNPYCWGNNSVGQVHDQGPASVASPYKVMQLDSTTNIATGNGTSCAVSDKKLRCWGRMTFEN